jgi:hypothetical protein
MDRFNGLVEPLRRLGIIKSSLNTPLKRGANEIL